MAPDDGKGRGLGKEGRSHHQPRRGGGGGDTIPSGLDQEHPERRAHRTAFLGFAGGIPSC